MTWEGRSEVSSEAHLASSPGDLLSFNLAFVSWWSNCCEEAAVVCACASTRTCNRRDSAAGVGPRLTVLQGDGAIKLQPRLPTSLLQYRTGDRWPGGEACSGLPHSSLSAAGEPERSCSPARHQGNPAADACLACPWEDRASWHRIETQQYMFQLVKHAFWRFLSVAHDSVTKGRISQNLDSVVSLNPLRVPKLQFSLALSEIKMKTYGDSKTF